MQISFSKPALPKSGAILVFAHAGRKLTKAGLALDKKTSGALTRGMKAARFDGKPQQIAEIVAPARVDADRIVIAGIGKPNTMAAKDWEALGGSVYAQLETGGTKTIAVMLDDEEGSATAAAHIATGLRLRSWRFDKYRTKEAAAKKPSFKKAAFKLEAYAEARTQFQALEPVIEGVFLTRDLVAEPANVLYPASFAERIKALEEDGLKVTVLGEKKLTEMGANALLCVGQGSANESFLVAMEWQGADDPDEAPVALVGKGVTFDTGGISLKPGAGMEMMKWDMGGAGTVVGAMKAIAGRKAKANVVGVVGLVENMPSSTAQRPGDVVTSMSGQTIEVINTDAEGRLVLADALWYTEETYNPRCIIDLATLTGAIIIALGHEYAGFYADHEELAADIQAASADTGDKVWRMPLDDGYDKMINTPTADMQNVGGKGAGSITAAQFLKRFIRKAPWAHIDIAGMAWSDKSTARWEKGATGHGVRLLDQFVANTCEAEDANEADDA